MDQGSIGWSLSVNPSFGPWLSYSEPTPVWDGPEVILDMTGVEGGEWVDLLVMCGSLHGMTHALRTQGDI